MTKMPTEQDKMEASYVIEVLLSCGFRKALSYKENRYWSDTYFDDWKKDIKVRKMLSQNDFHLYCGASKVCIVFDNEDWVIKVGFLRETNSVLSADIYDYCAKEAVFYEKAVECGCEAHFAATYYGGCVDGITFYLQERVTANMSEIESRIKTYNSNHYGENYEDCYDDADYIEAVLGDESSAEEVNALIDFVVEYDINDLHCGNWGITSDGRIVIIDFSGFVD